MKTKNAYITELQNKLDEWVAEIKVLQRDVLRVKGETRADLEKRIIDLQRRCEAGKQKIVEIRTSQETGWESLTAGADEMWNGLKQLFTDTKTAFKEGRADTESANHK